MKISKPNPSVDSYILRESRWKNELKLLRDLALHSGLTEEMKWGVPVYTLDGANVFLLHVFKEYCAILFVKGVLLEDPDRILVQQTKNVQAARQVRFSNAQEIKAALSVLRDYMQRAIEIEKAGLKVTMKKTSDFSMSSEFQRRLNESAELTRAFKALTPGRQRAYLLYFSAPKLEKTRESRVNKSLQRILNGLGLND